MTSVLGNPLAAASTMIFLVGIVIFAAIIISRFRTLEKTINGHLQTTDAIIAYIEHRREPELENKVILDIFNDYRAVLRDSVGESDYYIKFKRKNLELQKSVLPHMEFCRTSTETLPYIGLLGTVLGFLLTPDIIRETFASGTGGLFLALSSTAAALFFVILIKLFFESRVVPQYLQFEEALQAIESYGERRMALERHLRGEK
jgi:biopolymer transport protein ExbB/TolQ